MVTNSENAKKKKYLKNHFIYFLSKPTTEFLKRSGSILVDKPDRRIRKGSNLSYFGYGA